MKAWWVLLTLLRLEESRAALVRECAADADAAAAVDGDRDAGGRCAEGVDVVYTWVNGSESGHRLALRKRAEEDGVSGEDVAAERRFRDFGEASLLKYSILSQRLFAPWVRKVWIVSSDAQTQAPSWLKDEVKELGSGAPVEVVGHEEIFPQWAKESGALPTFDSCAIEMNLHRIPGLAECFLYLNDDVLFSKPMDVSHFWPGNQSWPFAFTNYQIAPYSSRNLPDWSVKLHNVAKEIRRRTNQKRQDVLLVGHHGHFMLRSKVQHLLETVFKDAYRTTVLSHWRSPTSFWLPFAYSNYMHAVLGAPRKRVHARYFSLEDDDGANCFEDIFRLAGNEISRSKFYWICFNDNLQSFDLRLEHCLARSLNQLFQQKA